MRKSATFSRPVVFDFIARPGQLADLRQQKGSGTWQLFCLDPSGAKVELDFDPSETL